MLDQSFYGNSILAWLVASGVALATAVALVVLRAQTVRWLTARGGGAHPHRTASALAALEGTRPWFLVIAALYAGAQFLALPPKGDRLVDHVTLIATIVQVAILASKAIRRWLAHQVAARRETDAGAATTVSVLGFFVQLGLWSVVLLLALENLGFNITALLAGLGIGGIAVALAAQSILGDLFASIMIALDKPFAIGDFVVLDNNMMGAVEYIGMKTTRLRSLSGEQIVIANADMLKSRLRNFQRLTERRVEFSLVVPPDTPAAKLAMIPGILRQAIEAQPKARFERAHFKSFDDNKLLFEAAYYVSDRDYNRYMDIQQAINLATYARLQKEAIAPVREPTAPKADKAHAAVPETQAAARRREPALRHH
ncbi:MAG TPA: mechanosensitive ion channel family protein [Casimicrobiaceae bacterium]